MYNPWPTGNRWLHVAALLTLIAPGAAAVTLVAPGMEDAALVASASLPAPLKHGLTDFEEDAHDALGHNLPIIEPGQPRRALIIVGMAGRDEQIDRLVAQGKIDVAPLKGLWESYLVLPVSAPFPGTDEALVIVGSDERGALYGLYAVSESVFGTDPQKFWTDHLPPRITTAAWQRGVVFQGEPSFRFRGFYVNDENFLMGWKGAGDDIEPEVWAKIFETILRMRGNTCSQVDYALPMKPETVALLHERGLYLTGSHVDLLLSNPMGGWRTFAQKQGDPALTYSYIDHPKAMEDFWRTGVQKHLGEQVLWPVGLRWTDDRDFYELDPHAPADWPSRGKVVNAAIAAQIGILRQTLPKEPAPAMVFSMRGDGHLKAFTGGFLDLPEDVICLYNDKGTSARFLVPPTPADLARHRNNGIYYHLTFCDNQWVQWVSPETIAQELGKAVNAGVTRMAIFNVGDIREIPLSLAVGMSFVYNEKAWGGGEDSARQFTRQWCDYQYGPAAGASVAALLADYFRLEEVTRASTVVESFQGPLLGLLPKVFKHWREGNLLDTARKSAGDPDALASDLGGYDPRQEGLGARFGKLGPEYLESVQATWAELEARATALRAQVPAENRSFYYDSVMLDIMSSRLASEFGLAMYRALQATKDKHFTAAEQEFRRAAGYIAAIRDARAPAAQGKWENWFRGEELTGWDGIPWGVTSSWSVHYDRLTSACHELGAICLTTEAKAAQKHQ